MNFNASRNVGAAGGLRKAKRVSDVAAMGTPTPPPPYSHAPAPAPGFVPQGPAPHYGSEGIQLDPSQDFGQPAPSGNFGYMGNQMGYPQSPLPAGAQQLGSMIQQPIIQDMALQYGNQLAAQGKAVVERELGRYVPVARLRYYFAVDTRYVLKKLLLIVFPFTHKEWLVKYDQKTPVQPRYDINAPDLYLPTMGYVTYVLLAGFMLGLQHRFSPEQLGIQASSALAYIIFEMILYLVTLYITNTSTSLKTLDLLAFSGYKYITMIASLICGLLFKKTGYYCCLVYSSFALSYFLVKTLRVQVLSGTPNETAEQSYSGYPSPYTQNPYAANWDTPTRGGGGVKRRAYFLLFLAVTQPLLSWWLTYHLLPVPEVSSS